MVEVTILKEICGFCDTTSLLYTNGAEHVDLLLEFYLMRKYFADSKVHYWDVLRYTKCCNIVTVENS